jgi:hypothetical protein
MDELENYKKFVEGLEIWIDTNKGKQIVINTLKKTIQLLKTLNNIK